jgi:hypothetical protein
VYHGRDAGHSIHSSTHEEEAMDILQEGEVTSEELRQALDEAKAKFGDAYLLEAKDAGISVVCRAPTRPLYRKFRAERYDSNPARRAGSLESLFVACLVYPDPKTFEATLNRMPALADSFGAALWDKVSGAEDATVKKT